MSSHLRLYGPIVKPDKRQESVLLEGVVVEAGRQACFGEILLLTQFSLLLSVLGHCCPPAAAQFHLSYCCSSGMKRCIIDVLEGGGDGFNVGHSLVVDSAGRGVAVTVTPSTPTLPYWAEVEDAGSFWNVESSIFPLNPKPSVFGCPLL